MSTASQSQQSYSPYTQTEWGVLKSDSSIPRLGHKYGFLNDPHSRAKLSKIRDELEITIRKVKRKQSDRSLILYSFSAIGILLSALFLNMREYAVYFISASALFYSSLFYILFKKVCKPASRDISYLKQKQDFLAKNMEEVVAALSGAEKSKMRSEKKSSSKKRRSRFTTDF